MATNDNWSQKGISVMDFADGVSTGRIAPSGRVADDGTVATAMRRGLFEKPTESDGWPKITVVIVTYHCADFIGACLQSLIDSTYANLNIVIVDNNSGDETPGAVMKWACDANFTFGAASDGERTVEWRDEGEPSDPPRAHLTILSLHANRGFASGVNAGLRVALQDTDCDLFWVLNPDTIVEQQTPFALARKSVEMGRFAVIGGRVRYLERPDKVQTDGGRLHPLAGTAVSVNIGADAAKTPLPAADNLAYIPGVSMLVSREFIETAGLMPERWFLYFEEIDWQLGRGNLPLGVALEASVLHRAGGSIGSCAVHRRAGPLSVYFTCRNLLPFVRKWFPLKVPFAYALALYKLFIHWGASRANIAAALRGLHGLSPPASIRARLGNAAWSPGAEPEELSQAVQSNGAEER
ncbi:MAG: glycosyltransferase family 2 protein [Devosia sp.]